MRRGTLLWTFFPPLVAILVVALLLVTGFAGRSLRTMFLEQHAQELEHLARVTMPRFAPLVAADDRQGVQALCRRLGPVSGSRLTIVRADGLVLGDSREDPALMDSHGDRPEIRAALAGVVGNSSRFSSTLGHQRLYVAVPGRLADRTAGDVDFVVRYSVSLASLKDILRGVYLKILLAGLLLAGAAGILSFFLARALTRPLQRLQDGAEAFAAGDLDQRLLVGGTAEMAALAGAMNRMAEQLDRRIATIVNQRNEREAVLTSMVEGVLAVDRDEKVIGLNAAGGRLLQQDPQRALGRSVQEVGRHPELTRMAQEILAGGGSQEQDIRLGVHADSWLQVHATGLVDAAGEPIGALLVLNDITRLRRLETMRRDFVANVSHELKTPITSIKGFVETLLEQPPAEAAEVERFLTIINRQADRLDAIISDLLALSRLEQDAERLQLELVALPLASVLERVRRDLEQRTPEAAGRLTLDCRGDLRARINAPLLEQAVGNLVGNALKYSPPGSPVTLTCDDADGEVAISVVDTGPGIAAVHLPRIFERFYRVDKARSRQLGGTGLGLAIVKHIAQAHHGRVTVVSEVGQGSTFTLTLPREDPA